MAEVAALATLAASHTSAGMERMQRGSLAEFLRQSRSILGITQADLAERVGVTAVYIGQMELGEVTIPSPDVVWRLAHFLGVCVTDLLRVVEFTPKEGSEPVQRRVELDIAATLLKKHHGNRKAALLELNAVLAKLIDEEY